MDPKTRYTVAVSTALVGAGVIAFGAGSALPQPGASVTTAALDGAALSGSQANASASEVSPGSASGDGAAVDQNRRAALNVDGAERRIAAPEPEKLPDWVRPADGYISSTFGFRFGGSEFHKGLDIAGPTGSPIRAAAAGKIIISSVHNGYGNLVAIDHGNGVTTYYGHNSKLIAHVGEEVQPGDIIALRGSTGDSTGPHCHFEVRIKDVQIDPMIWLHTHGVKI
ncbi:MAG: M23 family metallopeptidase [Terriglobales bacterium]